MWDLPRFRVKPVSSALADGFFTTEPPGKPKNVYFCIDLIALVTTTLICSYLCIYLNLVQDYMFWEGSDKSFYIQGVLDT